MPGVKRIRSEREQAVTDSIHPSRKRRLGYSEADAQRAQIFQDLADDLHATRIKAAGELLRGLSNEGPDQVLQINQALDRLIKGLCSGRKAARLGFSIALAETLRLAFNLAKADGTREFGLERIVKKIVALTESDKNVSGQEKREHHLGRRFAFQAILQSDAASSTTLNMEDWTIFNEAVVDLAVQKQWLRSECGAMLYEYYSSTTGKLLDKEKALVTINVFRQRELLKTPEGVALWLLMIERFSTSALPNGIWENNNPLSAKERIRLKKVLNGTAVESEGEGQQANSGARQLQPSFAWRIIVARLFRDDKKGFKPFWHDAVDNGLFSASSSVEKKALGMQIVQVALTMAPATRTLESPADPSLKDILTTNVVRCIINQRSDSERYLFEAAKLVLNQMVTRAKAEPATCEDFLKGLFAAGAFNIDQLTKTKTVDSILQWADVKGLRTIVRSISKNIKRPETSDVKEAETRRRQLVETITSLVRIHHGSSQLVKKQSGSAPLELVPWMAEALETLVSCGYEGHESLQADPEVTLATQKFVRTKLVSCLTMIMSQPIQQSFTAVCHVSKLLCKSASDKKLGSRSRQHLKQADETLASIRSTSAKDNSANQHSLEAYGLLFALTIIQVYNEDPDAVEVLQDLLTSFENLGTGDEDASSMVIEILLSFVSKPSQLFRKLAEQVFTTFASELTSDSLQSMLDILSQKENLSGQQELFEQHEENGVANGDVAMSEGDDDDSDAEEVEEDSDVEVIDAEDVEEDSDVEILNGQVLTTKLDEDCSDAEDSEEQDDDSDAETDDSADEAAEPAEPDDEEAEFDRKLAAALGTAVAAKSSGGDGPQDDSDDESDMDDEQMMALEPHLTTIFSERKKSSNKKQENKDAKEHVINFKNRVLDLLVIFAREQSSQILTLDLLHPLTELVRTTTSKPTAERAFAVLKTLFEACSKHKAVPQPNDAEPCFEILAAVHEEMKQGGSKLHTNACSRSSLFLAKVLVNLDVEHYGRVAQAYARLQSDWYSDTKSKVQGSVFTDWTSWSLTTRKQK